MSIGNQENLNLWRARAEVDYFTQFIKAWLVFNAWYRLNDNVSKNEHEIIDAIKNSPNTVRNRIVRLLEEKSDDAAEFRGYISLLHARLEGYELINRGSRVTFTNCFISANSTMSENGTYSGLTYKVQRTTSIECEILDRNGTRKFYKQQTKYDLDDLRSDTAFTKLSMQQRGHAESHYRAINPRLELNLLDTSEGSLLVGNHQFCANCDYVFAGLVEVIYLIRCLLFHGEVIPSNDVNDIYEAAYHVLRRLLRCIG